MTNCANSKSDFERVFLKKIENVSKKGTKFTNFPKSLTFSIETRSRRGKYRIFLKSGLSIEHLT